MYRIVTEEYLIARNLWVKHHNMRVLPILEHLRQQIQRVQLNSLDQERVLKFHLQRVLARTQKA